MFDYQNGILSCDGVSLLDIVKDERTPFYLYSKETLLSRVRELATAFSPIKDYLLAFAVKANNNLSLLRLLANEGMGADIISKGELFRYRTAGGGGENVIFSGVAKSEDEIAYAIDNNILLFNVESIPEIHRINRVAKEKNARPNVAVRINPNVEVSTHHKITTGKKGGKFGISVDVLKNHLDEIRALEHVSFDALACHIGSQILDAKPFYEAVVVMKDIIDVLAKEGITIRIVDFGGGFGIPYDKEKGGFKFKEYIKDVVPLLASFDAKVVFEPGRFIVGEAGALVMRVEYVKEDWEKSFAIVNAGMNDFMRVAIYDAHHDILPVITRDGEHVYDVAGPICESSDFFGKGRRLSTVREGDYIALMDTGAYGFSMANTYNGRARVAEYLVDEGVVRMIRRPETLDEMILQERAFLD